MTAHPSAGGRLIGPLLGRLILALPLLSFLLCLGGAPLFDVDEGAFSEATREMFERGDFLGRVHCIFDERAPHAHQFAQESEVIDLLGQFARREQALAIGGEAGEIGEPA